MDAILWLLRTACQWRNLPPCWPHWQVVCYYFDQWKKADLFKIS
ncbi:transposase [Spirosoma aerophilum]